MAAQFDLENALGNVSYGDTTTPARSQLQALGELIGQVGTANAVTLTMLQANVSGLVTSAHAVAQRARINRSDEQAAERLSAASRAVAEVGRDYYERRVLDPYLQFDSDEEKAAYHKREKENREAYEREKAKGTPEGERNAAAILKRQLLDAGAHGADASPDYAHMLDKASRAEADLQADRTDPGKASAPTPSAQISAPSSESKDSLDDVMARLKAVGVTTTDSEPAGHAHGLGDATRPARDARGPSLPT